MDSFERGTEELENIGKASQVVNLLHGAEVRLETIRNNTTSIGHEYDNDKIDDMWEEAEDMLYAARKLIKGLK